MTQTYFSINIGWCDPDGLNSLFGVDFDSDYEDKEDNYKSPLHRLIIEKTEYRGNFTAEHYSESKEYVSVFVDGKFLEKTNIFWQDNDAPNMTAYLKIMYNDYLEKWVKERNKIINRLEPLIINRNQKHQASQILQKSLNINCIANIMNYM